VLGSKDFLCLGRKRRHPLATSWARTHEDEFSDKVWPVDGELLRDKATHRESESVELLNAEGVDEGSCVLRHLFNRSRKFTARAGDAGVVEQDYSKETLCFFTTLAIGRLPPLDMYCVLIIGPLRAFDAALELVSQHSSIHWDGCPGHV
jgi:hypothetical protein